MVTKCSVKHESVLHRTADSKKDRSMPLLSCHWHLIHNVMSLHNVTLLMSHQCHATEQGIEPQAKLEILIFQNRTTEGIT